MFVFANIRPLPLTKSGDSLNDPTSLTAGDCAGSLSNPA